MHENDRSERIGLAEEQLEISKREVERGRVVVRTRVEERDEVAEIELQQQDVTIERVPRGVPIETAPAEREEDGVLIIPVVEEQLVVTKQADPQGRNPDHQAQPHRARPRAGAAPIRAGGHRAAGRPRPRSLSPRKGAPSMTDRTLTAMYDTQVLPRARATSWSASGWRERPSRSMARKARPPAHPPPPRPTGFWASLADLFMPDEDRHTYSEGLRRGGYLLTARVPDELEAAAADVLESSEPIDLDHRRESWRQEGWADYQAAAPASAAYGEGSGLAEVGTTVCRGRTWRNWARVWRGRYAPGHGKQGQDPRLWRRRGDPGRGGGASGRQA